MGWQQNRISVYGRVSRHNDDRDARDDALWEEFVERVRQLAKDYEGTVDPEVVG